MLYSSRIKILIPVRFGDNGDLDHVYNTTIDFYERSGFDVCILDSGHGSFNYLESKNTAIEIDNGDNPLVIVDPDTLVNPLSIENSFNLCKRKRVVVRPFHQVFRIQDKKSIKNIIDSLSSNEVIDSFYYSDCSPKYYMGGSWVMDKYSFESVGMFDCGIHNTKLNNFEFSIRAALFSRLVYLNYDAYSINHGEMFQENDIELFQDKLSRIRNYFPDELPDVSEYKNNKFYSFKKEDIAQIFNIHKYIKDFVQD